MKQETKDPRPEASEALAGLEEFKEASRWLVSTGIGHHVVDYHAAHNFHFNLAIGPWLPIEDGTNQSSAVFLTAAGWDARAGVLAKWLWTVWQELWMASRPKYKSNVLKPDLNRIEDLLKAGHHESAYIHAIVLLAKIDRPAYMLGLAAIKGEG